MSSQCSCEFLRKDTGYALLLHSRPIPESGRSVYLDESFTLISLPPGVTNVASCATPGGPEPMLSDQPVQGSPTQELLRPGSEQSCPVCHSSLEADLYDPVCGAHTVVRLLSLNPAVRGPSGTYVGKTRIAQIVRGKQDGLGHTLVYTMPDNCNCDYVAKPSRQYFVFLRSPLQSSENKVTHVAFTNQIHILAYSYRNSRLLQDAISACPTRGTEVPPVAEHRMDTYEAADQAVYGVSPRVPSGPLYESPYHSARHGASHSGYKAHDAGRSAYSSSDSSGYAPKPAAPTYNTVTAASHDGASLYRPSPASSHAYPAANAGYSAPAPAYAAAPAGNYGSAPSPPGYNAAASSYGASAVTAGYVGNSASYGATSSPTYGGSDSASAAPSYGGAAAYGPSPSYGAASSPAYGGYNAATVAPAYAGTPSYGPSPSYGATSPPTQAGYDSAPGAPGYKGAPAYGPSTGYGATSSPPYGGHNAASSAAGYGKDPAYGPSAGYAAPSSAQPATYATPSLNAYAAPSSGNYGATPHGAGTAPSYGNAAPDAYGHGGAGYAPATVSPYSNVPASAYSAPAGHSGYGAPAKLGYNSGSGHNTAPSYSHGTSGLNYKPAPAASHVAAAAGNYGSTDAAKYNPGVATYAPNYAGSPAVPSYAPMKHHAGAPGYSQPVHGAAPGSYNAAPSKGHGAYSPAGYSAVAHSSQNYGSAPAAASASSYGGAHYSPRAYGAPPPSYGDTASKSYGPGAAPGYGSAPSPGYKTGSASNSGSGYPAAYNDRAPSGVYNLQPAGYDAGHGHSAPSSAHASGPQYGPPSYGTSAGQNYQPSNGGGASSGSYADVTYVPPYAVPDYSPAYYEPLYPSEDEYAPVISYVPTYPPEEEYSVTAQPSYGLGGGYGGNGATYSPPAYAVPAYGQAYAPSAYSAPDNSHGSAGNAGYDSPYGTYAPPPPQHKEKHSYGMPSSPAYSPSSYGSLKPAPAYAAPVHTSVNAKRPQHGGGAMNPSYGFAPGGPSSGSYGQGASNYAGGPYAPAANAAPTYSQRPPGGSAPSYASAPGGSHGTPSGMSYGPASYGAALYSKPAQPSNGFSSAPKYPSTLPYDKKPSPGYNSPASQGGSYATSGYGPASYAAGDPKALSHGAGQPYAQPSRNTPGYSNAPASGASYAPPSHSAPSYGAGGRDSAHPPVSYTQPARGSGTYAAPTSPTPYAAAARPQSNSAASNYGGSRNNAASYATTVAYSGNAAPDTSYGMAPSYRSPSKATDESHGDGASYSAQPSASHSGPAYGNQETYTQPSYEDSHSSQGYTTASYGATQYTTMGSSGPSYGATYAPAAHSEPVYSQSASNAASKGQPTYSAPAGNSEHHGATYAPPSYAAPAYSPTNAPPSYSAPSYGASQSQPAYAGPQYPSYSAAVTAAPSYAQMVNALSSPYYGVRPYNPTMSPPIYAAASHAPPAYAAPSYARPSYVVSYAPPANFAPPYHGAAASPSYKQQSYGPSYAPPAYAAPAYAQPPPYNQPQYAIPAYTGATYAPPAYVAPAYGQPAHVPGEYSAPHYAPNVQPTYDNPTYASHAENPSYSGPQYVHPAYHPVVYDASYAPPVNYAPQYDVQYVPPAYAAPPPPQPSYSAPSSYVVSYAPPAYSAPSYVQPAYNEQPYAPTYAPPAYSAQSPQKPAYKQPSYGASSAPLPYSAPVYAQPLYNQPGHQGMAPYVAGAQHAASHSGYGAAPTTHVRYPPKQLAPPYAGNKQPMHPNYPQPSVTVAYSLPAYPLPSYYSPAVYANVKPSHGAPAGPVGGYGSGQPNYGPAPQHGLVYGAPHPHTGSHAAPLYGQPHPYNAAGHSHVTSAPSSYTAHYGVPGGQGSSAGSANYGSATGAAGSYGQGASQQGAYTTASYPAATPTYGSAYTTASGQSEHTTYDSSSFTTYAAASGQGDYTTAGYPTDGTYAPSYSQQSFTTYKTPATTYSSAPVYRGPVYERPGNTPAAYSGPTYAPPSYPAPTYSPPSYNTPSHSPPTYSAPAAYSPGEHSAATHATPAYSAPSYAPPSYGPSSYNAPSHSPPTYSAPAAYSPGDHSAATHATPAYSTPSYAPPTYSPPSYNAPSHSPPTYSAPAAYSAGEHSAATHATPAYSAPSYAPPSYGPPSYNAPSHSPPTYSAPAAYSTGDHSAATHATPAYSAPSYSPPAYEAPSHGEFNPSYFAPASMTTAAYSGATYSPSGYLAPGYSPPQAPSGPSYGQGAGPSAYSAASHAPPTYSGHPYGGATHPTPVSPAPDYGTATQPPAILPSYGRSAHTSAKAPPQYAPAKDVEAMYAEAHSIEGRYKPQCPQPLIGCPVCTKKLPEELLKNVCNYDLVAEGEVIHPPQPGRGYGGLCSDMCVGEVFHGGQNYNVMERIRFSLSKYCTCEAASKSFTKVIVFSYRHNWRAHGGSHGQLLLDDKTVVVPLTNEATAAVKAAANKCPNNNRYPMRGRAYSDAAYAGPAGCPDPFDESCPYCPGSVASEGLADDLCTSEYASVVAIGLDYRKMAEYKNGMFTWKQAYLPDIEVEEPGFGKNVSVTVKVNGTPGEAASHGEEVSSGVSDSCLTYTVKALYNVSRGSQPVADSYDLQLFLGKQCPCQHLKSQLPGYAVLVADKQSKLSGGVLQLGSGVKLYPLPYGTHTLPVCAPDQPSRASGGAHSALPPPELEIPVADDAQDAADEGPCPDGVQATCPVCLDAAEEPASTVTHYCKSEYAAVVSIPDDAFTSSTDSAIQPWWAPKIGISSSSYGSQAQIHVNVKPKARYQFPETDRTVGAPDNSRRCRSGRLHVKQVIAPGNHAEPTATVKFTMMSSCKCAFLEQPTQFAVLASKRPPSGDGPLHLADDVTLMALPLGKTEFPTCVRAEPKKRPLWKFW
ncbi:uncharacterized protein LOC144170589 isoform X1 [Haemaphysalis longicornis]